MACRAVGGGFEHCSEYWHACNGDLSVGRLNVQVPYRPASDPSALRASHSAPTPDSVEMPGVQGKRRRPQADAAERTAGAFQAAAARARNPEYRGYDRAERRAGLAGEGAQVCPSVDLSQTYTSGSCSRSACQAVQVPELWSVVRSPFRSNNVRHLLSQVIFGTQ